MEEVLNNFTLLLSNGLATYIIYRFMHVFFEKCAVDKKVAVLAYVVQYVISAFVLVEIPYVIINVLVSILCYGVIVWCYEGAFFRKVIVVAVIYSCGFVIEGVVFVLLENVNIILYEKRSIEALASLLVECIEWVVTIILEKRLKIAQKDIVPSFTFTLMVVGGIVLICTQEIMIFQQSSISDKIRILSVLVVMILTIIIIYLYVSMTTIAEEQTKNQMIEREKAYYHNQAKLLQNNSEELREFRHDLKNKMLVLHELLEKKEMKKVMEYLEGMENKIEEVENFSQSGNVVIDSIINYKLSHAKKQGCNIQAEISLPSQISIEDDDLVVVIGNLLDNAIEATEKLKENKYIQVKIKYDRGCLIGKFVNSFDSHIIVEKGKIQTRKENRKFHGVGLQSVKNIVDKYQGELKFIYKEEIFSVVVVMYPVEADGKRDKKINFSFLQKHI